MRSGGQGDHVTTYRVDRRGRSANESSISSLLLLMMTIKSEFIPINAHSPSLRAPEKTHTPPTVC